MVLLNTPIKHRVINWSQVLPNLKLGVQLEISSTILYCGWSPLKWVKKRLLILE